MEHQLNEAAMLTDLERCHKVQLISKQTQPLSEEQKHFVVVYGNVHRDSVHYIKK